MAGRKRPNPSAGQPGQSRHDAERPTTRAPEVGPRREDFTREAADSPPSRGDDGGVSLGQISMAEFARMSSSRQLSLWAILQAQMSSQKALAAKREYSARKVLPLSPEE